MENLKNNNLIHSFDDGEKKPSILVKVLVFLLVLVLGIGTGYGASQFAKGKSSTNTAKETASTTTTDTEAEGIQDTKNFKDTAEGLLKEGGIEGEGQYHLERPGGTSQNVYLTSSAIDLSKYVGKKVQVWGQTFTSEKAGWLMDVGKIKGL